MTSLLRKYLNKKKRRNLWSLCVIINCAVFIFPEFKWRCSLWGESDFKKVQENMRRHFPHGYLKLCKNIRANLLLLCYELTLRALHL